MQTFLATLNEMVFLFLCMLIGYIIRKKKIVPENASEVISKLETYVCIPALVFGMSLENSSLSVIVSNSTTVLYCVGVLAISCVIGFILAPRLTDKPENVGIFRYSLVFTNFGFMGQSVVKGVFGDEAFFSYFFFKFPAALLLYLVSPAWLSKQKGKFSWKFFLNPMYLAMLVGFLIGFSNLQMPSFFLKTVDGLTACYSPLAMLLTGIVIAKFNILEMLKDWRIYLLTAIRLVAIPLLFYGICRFINTPRHIMVDAMVFTAMPLGLYTIIIPAATGGDERPGASMAIISNIVGLITVPFVLSLVM